MNANSFFEKARPFYNNFFDIEAPSSFGGTDLIAKASFNSRNERYVLVKRAAIWAFESNEHVLFADVPSLNKNNWEDYKQLLIKAQDTLVKPHDEHMYSYVTLVLLCQNIDKDVEKLIRVYRRTVNYRLSVWGYSCARVAAVGLNDGKIITNRRGKELVKLFGKIFS